MNSETLQSVEKLNRALATELVCVLRYKHHYHMASGLESPGIAAEFKEHAADEQEHADQIADRIKQLNGVPNFSPDGLLSRSDVGYRERASLYDMIKDDLAAERVAIHSYREMITYFSDKDPTTRRLLEEILAKEEEHADDLASLVPELAAEKKAAA